MTKKTRAELIDFVVDHVKHLDCMPVEFEDSSERVWAFDEFVDEIPDRIHKKLSKMMGD